MNDLFHGIDVIWLDRYIGDPQHYSHLKAAFSSNIDPTNPEPIKLVNPNTTNTSFSSSYSLSPRRFGIPCELRTFVDSEACLRYIHNSFEAYKRIFLIVPDYIGRTFLPHIVQQCPELFHSSKGEARISFYILTSCIEYSMDWLFDYEDYALMYDHEIDLLGRLVHDIAKYYVETGKELLAQNTRGDAQQALIYFEWAITLSLHAKNITIYQDSQLIKDLENSSNQAEEKIKNDIDSVQNVHYSRANLERSLNSSLFIYHSTEFYEEIDQLLSTLRHLTGEQVILFDNSDNFVANLQTRGDTIKYCCPIIISSNNDDRMKILKALSSLSSINYIYVFSPNEHTLTALNDQTLLKNFPKVRNIYLKAKTFVFEWVVERASTCKKIGELCTENGDVDLARKYYAKAIALNERLSAFMKNN